MMMPRVSSSCLVGVLSALLLTEAVAQENNASVTKGVFEFQSTISERRTEGVIARIASCWKQFEINKSQDAAAFCFAMDYLANDFAEFISKKDATIVPEPLLIEKVNSRVNVALKQLRIEQSERGKLIAGWIRLAERVLTSGQDKEVVATEAETEAVFAKAKQVVSKKIHDASAARFGKLERHSVMNHRGTMAAVVCGAVEVRLPSGSYSGPRRFVYFLQDHTAYYDEGKSMEVLDAHMKHFCSH